MSGEDVRLVEEPVSRDWLRPNLLERAIAVAAMVLLVLVLTALVRGWSDRERLPPLVWWHLATVLTALAITPVQLLRRRGDALHRALGVLWAVPLFVTAVLSFGIRDLNAGGLSFIHIFSAVTVVSVPWLVVAARHHRLKSHRHTVQGLTLGALLGAGYFTLLPSRQLGMWLYG